MSGHGDRAVRVGREYLRVSQDRSGRERSPDEQHEDNERATAGYGISLGEPYREAGSASASRFASKARKNFDQLLEDLASGEFTGSGATVLVLWESSRGSRKVGEWVTLIELCEQQGVSIYVTTHGREYQPGNARDRRSLLEDAVDSEYESSKVSARALRASAANARAGKPHGRAPFGYLRRYDERTRVMIAQEPDPVQAPVIQKLFARLKAGHTLMAIARDFEAEGVVNLSGRPFSAAHLRALAVTPAYAGIRVHRPKRARPTSTRAVLTTMAPGIGEDGRDSGGDRSAAQPSASQVGGTQVEGTWPALVSKADFLAVQAILSDPKRVTTRPGKARHLLSMIARCAECGDVLSVTLRAVEEGEYQCRKGHVRVRKAELDEYATAAILGYLARPDVHELLSSGEERASSELGGVRDELAGARAELDVLRGEVGAGRLSVASLVAAEPGILARITALEAREAELVTPSALRGLITPGDDVAARWDDAPVAARRAIARLLLTPDHLGELRVHRRPPGQRNTHVDVAERAEWVRAEPVRPV
jgi:site-specific DNA recombinase